MTGPDRYGVMGYPVSHSRSPVIHKLFAMQTGQDIRYELLQVAPEKLEEAIRQFQRTGGKGLNITVPHKTAVVKIADHLSERARTAGAVNTLTFRNSEIYGDNTDGIGLLRDLAVNLGVPIEDASILILGEWSNSVFAHGVASGDPDEQSVVIWTRISTAASTVEVEWQLADDPDDDTAERLADYLRDVDSFSIERTRMEPFRVALGCYQLIMESSTVREETKERVGRRKGMGRPLVG